MSTEITEVITSKSHVAEGVTLKNTCDLRYEGAKSEAEIRTGIAKSTCDILSSNSEQTNHLNLRFADVINNVRDSKEEAMKANFEGRLESNRLAKDQMIETLKSTDSIKEKIGCELKDIRHGQGEILGRMGEFHRLVDGKIDYLSKQVAVGFGDSEKHELRGRVAELKNQLDNTRLDFTAQRIVDAINGKVIVKG